MLAAVVVLLDSVDSAAAAVRCRGAGGGPGAGSRHEPQLRAALAPPVLAQVPQSRCCCTCCRCYCPRWWSNQRYPAPAGPPVVLSRNGKEFTANGETNVRAGTEYKVTTERPTVNINVKELDTGSWVMFELPGFTTAASGTEQSSLDALRKASATSYYKGNGCALGQDRLHR